MALLAGGKRLVRPSHKARPTRQMNSRWNDNYKYEPDRTLIAEQITGYFDTNDRGKTG